MAFLGPKGAGKTSTIDMILGLSRPDAGAVEVYGMAPRQAVRKGLVSAVTQTGGLLKDLTVAETAQYTASLFAVSRPVGEVLERAGITAIAGRRVGRCSGGEQQRLRFAMALIPDPELLILDEPTQGMDVEGRRGFWQAIREDAASGRTIVFATHYLEEADAYADRIVLISKGQIVADGTAAEVKGLASGRPIRATLPGADEAALRAMPGADGVEVRGDTILIHSGDSEAVARRLLTQTPGRRHPAMDLDLEPGRVARDLRDRRRLAPAPRHCTGVIHAVTCLMCGSGRPHPIQALARRAGIAKAVTPHTLRHAFITAAPAASTWPARCSSRSSQIPLASWSSSPRGHRPRSLHRLEGHPRHRPSPAQRVHPEQRRHHLPPHRHSVSPQVQPSATGRLAGRLGGRHLGDRLGGHMETGRSGAAAR